jgi:hypothetical protein
MVNIAQVKIKKTIPSISVLRTSLQTCNLYLNPVQSAYVLVGTSEDFGEGGGSEGFGISIHVVLNYITGISSLAFVCYLQARDLLLFDGPFLPMAETRQS